MNGTPASAASCFMCSTSSGSPFWSSTSSAALSWSVRAAISRRAVVVLPAPVAPNSTTCCPAPSGSRGPCFPIAVIDT